MIAIAVTSSVNQGVPNQIAAIRSGRPTKAVTILCLSMSILQALTANNGSGGYCNNLRIRIQLLLTRFLLQTRVVNLGCIGIMGHADFLCSNLHYFLFLTLPRVVYFLYIAIGQFLKLLRSACVLVLGYFLVPLA